MHHDDRLATVLRNSAGGEAASRTQYRQLLDLLGTMAGSESGPRIDEAYARLDDLAQAIPGPVQSRILREPGLRLRNPALVAHLAQAEPQAAAAALATARLSDAEWQRLIPRLPLVARGFLRHRRDLPAGATGLLNQLGVQDLVLPEPPGTTLPHPAADPGAAPTTAAISANADDQGISRIVRRIEEFQRARRDGSAAVPPAARAAGSPPVQAHLQAPHLPLDGLTANDGRATVRAASFSTDAAGTIDWADAPLAPLLVGLRLAGVAGAATPLDAVSQRAMARHQPISGAHVLLPGAPAVAGDWRLDAVPAFCPVGGAFSGYRGQLRRPAPAADPATQPANPAADRMRQVLHELRTPVNAVQGFAEIIQQQLFGPVPNEYRALAAAVAVDAARLLGGFEDMDRLARLQLRAMDLADGVTDLREVVADLAKRLDGVLRPRSAMMELAVAGSPFTIGLAMEDAQLLAWRLLATLAGALAPGETIRLDLSGDGQIVRLAAELPLTMAEEADLFTGDRPAQARAISAGMFGTGFTLRLARAEAEAIGGTLESDGEVLTLSLPVAMHDAPNLQQGDEAQGGMTAA